jgi:hypothetical protein
MSTKMNHALMDGYFYGYHIRINNLSEVRLYFKDVSGIKITLIIWNYTINRSVNIRKNI